MCLCNSKHLVTAGKDYINNSRMRPDWPCPGARSLTVRMEEAVQGHLSGILELEGRGPSSLSFCCRWDNWQISLSSEEQGTPETSEGTQSLPETWGRRSREEVVPEADRPEREKPGRGQYAGVQVGIGIWRDDYGAGVKQRWEQDESWKE